MRRLVINILLWLGTLMLSPFYIYGQSLPVGTPVLEDAFRRAQLIGNLDQSISFMVRPCALDSSFVKKSVFQFKMLPMSWQQQYNSDHPEGMNDGAMIPARGYQTMIRGGFFTKIGPLSVQLMPELVYAENRNFQGFPDELKDDVWSKYNNSHNLIDIPERFGENTYKKAFWGQSSVRLTISSISLGLSNENLWWGPGLKNSLLMTNNAPGFKHITLNTVKPIHTFIGSFEGQLLGGRLDASGYPGIDSAKLANHNLKYTAKPNDWRYLNGVILTYQPRWLPGLFLGAARSFISYHKEMGTDLKNYFPVIIPLFKETLGGLKEDTIPRDQLASVFMRWVAPESHMEIYLEYGREDHSWDLTDLLLEPDHTRGYVLGFRKMTPINRNKDEFIDIQFETIQLGKNLSSSRAGITEVWYIHTSVLDGYTHNGQYLGAGVGTSSNMQSLNISWVKNYKRIGLEMTRLAHNENFWASVIQDYRSHWVDVSGALIGAWDYKKFLFNAKIQGVGSINYQWYYDPVPSDPPFWWDKGKIRYNIHAELCMTYVF